MRGALPGSSVQTMAFTGQCGRCARPVPPGFRLRGGDLRCWRHVMGHPAVYRSALLAPLVVDLLLTPINQGDVILTHGFTTRVLFKIVLTYLVCRLLLEKKKHCAPRIPEPSQSGGGD